MGRVTEPTRVQARCAIERDLKTVLSSNQINRLHHTFFVPQGDVKAALLIVHDLAEHSARYDELAAFLAQNGVLVATFDLLGHGQTAKDPYEMGFFDGDYPLQTLSKDVLIMLDALREKTATIKQQVPIYLLGHGFGALLVQDFLRHHSGILAGAALSGVMDGALALPALFAQSVNLALQHYRQKRPNKALTLAQNRYLNVKAARFGTNHYAQSPLFELDDSRAKLDSGYAWRAYNLQAVADYHADPLCGFVLCNNAYFARERLAQKAAQTGDVSSSKAAWFAHLSPLCRVLILGGIDDPLGNTWTRQSLPRALHLKLAAADKNSTLHLFAKMRHDIWHESARTQPAARLLDFVLGARQGGN